MRSIPKRFNVLGHTIKVVTINRQDWATLAESYPAMEAVTGFYNTALDLIVVKQQQKEHMLHTFYHEMMHAVLYHMDHKLWEDEKFVDKLSAFITQAELTST